MESYFKLWQHNTRYLASSQNNHLTFIYCWDIVIMRSLEWFVQEREGIRMVMEKKIEGKWVRWRPQLQWQNTVRTYLKGMTNEGRMGWGQEEVEVTAKPFLYILMAVSLTLSTTHIIQCIQCICIVFIG